MTENWTGEYTYVEGYPEELKGKSVVFKLIISNTEGEIIGTCTDDEADKVFTEPATIKGFIDNNIISFIKKYPYHWETDEDGNSIVFENTPSVEIHYYGNFQNGRFSGDWDMSMDVMTEDEKWMPFTCEGTWSMEKDN